MKLFKFVNSLKHTFKLLGRFSLNIVKTNQLIAIINEIYNKTKMTDFLLE